MADKEPAKRVELLQGTLDLIVLRVLSTMGPQHAYGIASRLEQLADDPFTLNQGTLYPALVRLEQKGFIKGAWKTTENNRDARFYAITSSGTRRSARRPSAGGASRAWSTSSSSAGPNDGQVCSATLLPPRQPVPRLARRRRPRSASWRRTSR